MSPRVWVPGVPAPQGSKRYVGRGKGGRGIMLESSKRVGPWRERVALAVAEQLDGQAPTRKAIALSCRFVFTRPRDHFGRKPCDVCAEPTRAELEQRARELEIPGRSKMSTVELAEIVGRPRDPNRECATCGGSRVLEYVLASARRVPSTVPDLSKLVRAVEDALAGIAYVDDAQIVTLNVGKEYGNAAGAELRWDVIA